GKDRSPSSYRPAPPAAVTLYKAARPKGRPQRRTRPLQGCQQEKVWRRACSCCASRPATDVFPSALTAPTLAATSLPGPYRRRIAPAAATWLTRKAKLCPLHDPAAASAAHSQRSVRPVPNTIMLDLARSSPWRES